MQNQENWHKKIKLCELLYLSHYKKKKKQNKWEHYETEQIKTCMFLTVRGRANKAELFLEPRKKKKEPTL